MAKPPSKSPSSEKLGDVLTKSKVRRAATADTPERLASHERASNAWRMSRVPERYQDADFLTLEGREDLPAGYMAAVNKVAGLITTPAIMALIGGHGTGKTWIGCGLIREFCRNGKSAMYTRAIDFFVDQKSTFGSAAKQNIREVEEIYRRPTLLVIDEMDVRADTAWEDMVLTGLIDARYAAMKPTLLISNRSKVELAERLGARLSDRLRDDGGAIVCDWESLRGKATAERKRIEAAMRIAE